MGRTQSIWRGTRFGMRSFAGNFTPEELKQAVDLCHRQGVRRPCDLQHHAPQRGGGPAARVAGVSGQTWAWTPSSWPMWGLLALAKRYAPRVQCHISTQASIVNYQSARAWHDLGASRVILARELSLEEIREIRAKTPKELEIEAFAHGAMCVSYSGRCLLSNYMTGPGLQPGGLRPALPVSVRPDGGEASGRVLSRSLRMNGETYIMNSRDMCMIDHLADLMEAGVDSV